MKKIFLLTALTLIALGVQAKKAEDIQLISGNPAELKNGADAYLVIDYSNTECEGKPLNQYLKEQGDDWVNDWENEQKSIQMFFTQKFNGKFKKLGATTVQTINKGSRYRLVFNVEKLDMGSTGGGIAASILLGAFARTAGGAKVSGTIEYFDMENKERLLKLQVNEIQGNFTYSVTARIGLAVYETALQIGDFVKKFKGSPITDNEPLPAWLGGRTKKTNDTGTKAESITADNTTPENTAGNKAPKTITKPAPKSVQQTTAKTQRRTEVPKPEIPELLLSANSYVNVGKDGTGGSFKDLKKQKHIGIWFDFSKAFIRNNKEEDFISYMENSARDKDRDPNFGNNWNDIKNKLTNRFIEKANDNLDDMKIVTALNTDYVIKAIVTDINEDGDMECKYCIVDMSDGFVVAEIDIEEDGGRIGRFIGLMEQGFENSGKEFGKTFKKAIKKSK